MSVVEKTPTNDVALAIRDLTAGYTDAAVLDSVTLSVPSQSVVALLGPNGAGKTTLLRVISGLLPVRFGRVEVHGRDISKQAAHARANSDLCHIPEGRGIYRSLTVGENLQIQGRRSASGAAERALEAFPVLTKRLRQRAGTLSGGEQQMLAMSAAYVRNPNVVLVDEASLGLSPKMIDEVFSFITTMSESGAAVLVVDQFVHRALDVATHAYVLRRGRVVASGPAAGFQSADLSELYLGSAPA